MLYDSLNEALRIRAEKGQYITHQSYDEHLDPAVAWGARLRLADFASNDTLSIARNPRVANAYKDTIAKLAVSPLGATGSRGTSGNTPFHQELEKRLALFHNSEAAILFNSGYDANLTLWQTLPQPGDAIVYDESAHASIIDGLRKSRADSKIKFSHNSLLDLGNILKTLSVDSKFRTGENNVFIAVEAVHSMNGTMAALQEITTVMKEIFPRENAFLIVDEAHSTGVYGERGTGLCNQLQLENDAPIRVHTFGKAIGCAGAVLICPKIVKDYITNYGLAYRFTTSATISNIVAINIAYNQLESPQITENTNHVFEMSFYLRSLLKTAGLTFSCPLEERTHVTGVFVEKPRDLAAWLLEQGILVSAITYPVVPQGTDRIRVCTHLHNTREEVERLVTLLGVWVQIGKSGRAEQSKL